MGQGTCIVRIYRHTYVCTLHIMLVCDTSNNFSTSWNVYAHISIHICSFLKLCYFHLTYAHYIQYLPMAIVSMIRYNHTEINWGLPGYIMTTASPVSQYNMRRQGHLQVDYVPFKVQGNGQPRHPSLHACCKFSKQSSVHVFWRTLAKNQKLQYRAAQWPLFS
jgi:hypothetical protein